MPRCASTAWYASQATSKTGLPGSYENLPISVVSLPGPMKSYSAIVVDFPSLGSGKSCEAEIGTAHPPRPPQALSDGALYRSGASPRPPQPHVFDPERANDVLLEQPPAWPPTSWTKPHPPSALQSLEPRQVW